MKRHEALISYSHSHHEALLVALRLKKGGPSSPHDTLWPKEPLEQAQALLRFADRELSPHFEQEEQLLFPAARGKYADLDGLIDSLLTDHNQFRKALEEISGEKSVPVLSLQLKSFGEMLEKHIRTEERDLFPRIEAEIEKGGIILLG